MLLFCPGPTRYVDATISAPRMHEQRIQLRADQCTMVQYQPPKRFFKLEDQRPAEHLELLAEKLAAARTQQLPTPTNMSLYRTTVR